MKSVQSLLFFKPMKEPPTVFPFGPIAELVVIPKRPYRPGEKCYVREQYANLKALREQAKRLIEQWPYGSYEMPSNIDDGPDVIYKSDWDAQGKKFVGKWIFTTAESARRFVTVLSCEPIRVSEVTEEDAIRLGFTFDEYNQVMARENFENDWHQRHPGTWAWRVESEEIKS